MRIFVIGGTGLVGSYLLPKLIAQNHEVLALTRSKSKLGKIEALGAKGIYGDILNPDSFVAHLDNIEFIVLLAMPGVKPGKRVSKKRYKELEAETTGFFQNSLELTKKFNSPIILPGGTSYQTKDDEIADESWPIKRVGLTKIGEPADRLVDAAIETGNPKTIQLLYGKIYGNGGIFKFQFDMIQKGRFKNIGKASNYIPNIHAEDAAEAIIKAINKKPFGERILIVDDEPVMQKEYNNFIADQLGIKRPGHIPGFIIRLVIGNRLYQIVKMNCKVSNAKAKTLLEWKPKYPGYKEGLPPTLQEMKEKPPYFS